LKVNWDFGIAGKAGEPCESSSSASASSGSRSATKLREALSSDLPSLEGRWEGVTSRAGRGRRFTELVDGDAGLSGRRSSGSAGSSIEEEGMRGSLEGGIISGSSRSIG